MIILLGKFADPLLIKIEFEAASLPPKYVFACAIAYMYLHMIYHHGKILDCQEMYSHALNTIFLTLEHDWTPAQSIRPKLFLHN